jgi:hypothetical protein
VTQSRANRDQDFKATVKAEDILDDQAAALFDLAEIERREAEETGGHTTEEVMRHLESLERVH